MPLTCCLVTVVVLTGLTDANGAVIQPGLRVAAAVAVPALNIPSAVVDVLVAGNDGVVRPNVTLQVSRAGVCGGDWGR
jgi:hypothetical protein